jgi:hypothetical protein
MLPIELLQSAAVQRYSVLGDTQQYASESDQHSAAVKLMIPKLRGKS